MARPRRLLTVAHSYVVAQNRRLAHELARTGAGAWEVTAVAPEFMKGDLRPIRIEDQSGEACRLEPVPAYLTGRIHVMAYGRRLCRLLAEGWDLIHCWEEPFILAGAQTAFQAPHGTRLVFATFQNIRKRYPVPFCWFERYAMRRACGWVALGQTVKAALADRPGYAERPFAVIPPGVDLECFTPDAEAGSAVWRRLGWAEDGPPVVGYLGRLVPQKGLRLLTRVLDRLPVPWRALLVGGGPLEVELRAWAARHGGRARIVTGVAHDQVPAYLNAMDVLCAPSQTTLRWREQFGRMLIEAFACGVPVLGSDSGEIPHVLAGAGRVVGESDEDGWAAALAELLDSPSRRAELASLGLGRVHAEFAWPVVARKHLDFFGQLLP